MQFIDSIRNRPLSAAAALALACCAGTAGAELTVRDTGKGFELTNDTQRVVVTPGEDGSYAITTDVQGAAGWTPLFDAARPLVIGENFDLVPTQVEIAEDSPGRKALRLSGTQTNHGYGWSATISASSGTQLLHFTITCELTQPLTLTQPQPAIGLWTSTSSPTLVLDQGPESPTGDAYNVPFNFGFPAAYLWDGGREAAIFFDFTSARWFSREGVFRLLDVQVKSTEQDGAAGLGMIPRRHWGSTIAAGPMTTEFYLHAASRAEQPTKFQALDTMLQAFAPLHPATGPFPKNTLAGGDVSWTSFTQQSIKDQMIEGLTMIRIPTPWPEAPVDLGLFAPEALVHNSFIKDDPEFRKRAWQFSTTNHNTGAWMLYARMHPEGGALDVVRTKKDTLGRFQDHVTGMITSGIRPPDNNDTENLLEISWQSLVFYQAFWQIAEATAYEDFNPSNLGRLLIAADSLIEYAHNVDYLFSTYFDPYAKQPKVFSENNDLGAVREPWSVGSYVYVMMRYHQITGEERYREEARRALDHFMNTLSYSVHNKYIDATYSEPMDMPIMELMGNGYGAVGIYRMFQESGDPALQRTARDFLNTLLRQTYWFEDNTDAVSRSMNTAGLFYAFVGASCATPWETQEANFALAWMLREDAANPLNPLLLKLTNLNRINGFNFYPATYADVTRALNPDLRRDVGQYFPIEELYGLEAGGGSTGRKGTAQYMSSHAMWSWWLYEALAEADDRAVMVLNPNALDNIEEAYSGANRTLIVYNPEPTAKQVKVLSHNLAEGEYSVTIADAEGRPRCEGKTHTAEALRAGLPLELAPGEALRLTIRATQDGTMQIEAARQVRFLIARAYQAVQQAGAAGLDAAALEPIKAQFEQALAAYRARDLAAAGNHAREVLAVRAN